MEKITTVKYFDDDTTETVKIAATAYGIEVLATYPTESEHEIFVTVGGKKADVKRFLDDLFEGDLEPFEATRDMSDNEYQDWLKDELAKYGYLYIPAYCEEDVEEVA